MRANKLFKRQKAENGAGRSVKIKHVLLPEEVVEDLKLFKDSYTEVLGTKVTFEQMIRRWMDHVSRFDPDVASCFNEVKVLRQENVEKLASSMGLTAEDLKRNEAAYDPTDGAVWELKYFFTKDGQEISAHIGDKAPFYATIDGRNVGMSRMLSEEWDLINELGVEITLDEARVIQYRYKKHQEGSKAF